MMTAFLTLTVMIAWISFLAVGAAGWVIYCMLKGRPIL